MSNQAKCTRMCSFVSRVQRAKVKPGWIETSSVSEAHYFPIDCEIGEQPHPEDPVKMKISGSRHYDGNQTFKSTANENSHPLYFHL